MSNRRPFPIRAGASLAAVAALLTACGMPQAMDPPPPPMAEAEPPMLYGGPEGEMMAAGPCLNDPYPAAVPPPACDLDPASRDDAMRAYAEAQADAGARPPLPEQRETIIVEERRRPGWGTMAPVPNPGEGERAYAEGRRGQPYGAPESVPYAPRGYVEARPAPDGEAMYSEGVPTAAQRSLVVTMEPVPNPSGTTRAGVDDDATRSAPPPRRVRRASDEGLLGGPAAGRAQAAPARRAEAAPARRPATAAAAPSRAPQRAAVATATPRKAATAKQTTRSGAKGMEHFRNVLSQLVQRDSTLTAPADIVPGRTEQVTLTLPATLAETLAREARAAGMRDAAAGARIRAGLTGEGWRIEPGEPQTTAVRPGRTASFTWQATPERGAGRLQAEVGAQLPRRGGGTETLNLAQLNGPELGGSEQRASGGGGVSARTLAAGFLLLLALALAFWFMRKRDDSPATVGGTRRRRYREPVNLTPYAPNADTPAPATGPNTTT